MVQEDYKPGFFVRHFGKIAIGGGVPVALYLISMIATTSLTQFIPIAYEEFIPRKRIEITYHPQQMLSNGLETSGRALISVSSYPLELSNLVTFDRYEAVRNKAYEIAGVDENNPEDDAKRFQLYRQLGFAVKKTNDVYNGIYIPFEVWRKFIEQNSNQRVAGADKWYEGIPSMAKYYSTLLGRAFFKADSKSQGGNEDGIVDAIEWVNALKQMGYTTIDTVLAEITKQFKDPEDLRAELQRIITETRTNPNFLFDTPPKLLPRSRLENYVSSK